MTDEPVKEVEVGKEILRSLSLATRNVELIACPTCGRLEVDLFGIMRELEKRLEGVKKPVKIAVLGCVVNGPGEAAEADIGIAAGKGVGILYRKGEVVRRVKESEIVDVIVEEVNKFDPNNRAVPHQTQTYDVEPTYSRSFPGRAEGNKNKRTMEGGKPWNPRYRSCEKGLKTS